MEQFIQRHASNVIGCLSGFDRVRMRGTVRWLANLSGMSVFLKSAGVLLKQFTTYAQRITAQIRERAVDDAEAGGRPVIYLPSSQESKEEIARDIARCHRVREGLICLITCVEPCYSYKVGPNAETKKLELRYGPQKCLHYYHYLQDPQLGFLHVRQQTWFPFNLHVCFNGREWLARQMDAAGLRYVQRDNCFADVQDVQRAQQLLDEQLRVRWSGLMNRLMRQVHPLHRKLFPGMALSYYWSVDESEWASDVMFRTPQAVSSLYPRLVRHALTGLGSEDVMRFLGYRMPLHGGVHGKFAGQVVTDLKVRPEGVRVKHRVNSNSIKMYDKQGTVLRVETTLHNVRDLKVYRTTEAASARARRTGRPPRRKWRRMRKGVADLHRRAKLCQAANGRYLEAMAKVDDGTPLGELTTKLCQPTTYQGRRVRALNPFGGDDAKLLAAIGRGEFTLQGFRNRDLRPLLFGNADTPEQARKQAAAVSRRLRMLRAHGLITKIAKTHRYQLTDFGRTAVTAIIHAQHANTAQLIQIAA